jgi:chromate reductase
MSDAGSVHIAAFSGSLRRDSYNSAMLRAAATLLPQDTTLDPCELAGIPFYDFDVEQRGFPPPVTQFRQRLAAADALLIATPEYNYSTSGVLKNALEWASRPPNPPLSGKPCALMGASVSPLGTARGQFHLRHVCVSINLIPLNAPHVDITEAKTKFDDGGGLTHQPSLDLIRALLAELRAFTLRLRG